MVGRSILTAIHMSQATYDRSIEVHASSRNSMMYPRRLGFSRMRRLTYSPRSLSRSHQRACRETSCLISPKESSLKVAL